jgi:tripartite-type tricarboxylate transporter receptor subunit TctC
LIRQLTFVNSLEDVMKITKTMKLQLMGAMVFASLMAAGAHAQTFPDKTVKVITQFPTGTGPDTMMRLIGERLARIWGHQLIVENKPGGNGWIALEAGKRSAPDGYTLLLADTPPMAVSPHLFKRLPYDPAKDFAPVAPLYRNFYFVTVAAGSKWNTVTDLINAAKSAPGKVSYGSSGVGGNLHIGGAMMENGAGIKMTHVPYKETPQIYIAIANGDIDWAAGSASTTKPMLQANKVKYLAITTAKRSPLFPDVPTVSEAGGPANYELVSWSGLFAPAGTPKAIIDKINADVARVLQEPDVRARMVAVGFEPLLQSPEDFGKLMQADSLKYKGVVKEMNISLD